MSVKRRSGCVITEYAAYIDGAGVTPRLKNERHMTPLASSWRASCGWPLAHRSPKRPGEHYAVILGVTHAATVVSCYLSFESTAFFLQT